VYALLPTGSRANRVFFVGTLTETEEIGAGSNQVRGRVVDPTGTFFVYAGQYQPDAAETLRSTDAPAFVGVVGKPEIWESDNGNLNVSIRPEEVVVVSDVERDEWVIETASHTLNRIDEFDAENDQYDAMAAEQYDSAPGEYRDAVIEALESLGAAASASDGADEQLA
jgi:RPA family protein